MNQPRQRIKETRIGQWLKSRAPHILETVGGYFTLRSLVDKRPPKP